MVMLSNRLIHCHPLFLLSLIFPSIRLFPVSWLFKSCDQRIGASATVLPMNIQGWFPLGLIGLISLPFNRLSWVFSSTTILEYQFSTFFTVQLSRLYMPTGKTIALTRQNFVGKAVSLLFNMLSRLVTAFLLRSKCLLNSWLQSPSTVILEPPKIKSLTVSIVSPSICHELMELDAMIFSFWMLSFKSAFSLSSFTFIKRFLVSLHFLPLE